MLLLLFGVDDDSYDDDEINFSLILLNLSINLRGADKATEISEGIIIIVVVLLFFVKEEVAGFKKTSIKGAKI